MKTWLYLHKDELGTVLYAGISSDPLIRTAQHAKTAEWFDQVRSIDVKSFDNRELAIQAESKAILDHNPAFNRVLVVEGKVMKISWKDEARQRYLELRTKVMQEIEKVGYFQFLQSVRLNPVTMQKIFFDEASTPTNKTMDKIDEYFRGKA